MKDRILEILRDLVAQDSITATEKENRGTDNIVKRLEENPYFKQHPDHMGVVPIPNDPYGRRVPYGLILGKKKDTVILGGHSDVVSAGVYGKAEPYAFSIDRVEEYIKDNPMTDGQREDLESGNWIWGRGTADMKGGIALNLALMEKYGQQALENNLEGSILMIAVPDEESYSAGMRGAIPLLAKLKVAYGLKYKLLINPEPAAEMGDAQVMGLGSVGKTLPVVVTQGQVAHIGYSFNGISALNMLANLFQKTNGSLEFCDDFEGESTVPPIWAKMRDRKEEYDASLPARGYGYFTVFSFTTTLPEILEKLKTLGIQAFEEEVEKLNRTYQEYKKKSKFAVKDEIHYPTAVYTVAEFCEILEKQDEDFPQVFEKWYREAGEDVQKGMPFPDATVKMMEKLLDYSNIKTPLILIGAAPPYYPPTHSDQIPGREGFGQRVYAHVEKISREKFGQPLTFEHYFMGISDNSYTSVTPMDYVSLEKNIPLWGDLYALDFSAMEKLSVPSILYGPIGREYHQWSERVNKHSLLEVMPVMLQETITFAWNNE